MAPNALPDDVLRDPARFAAMFPDRPDRDRRRIAGLRNHRATRRGLPPPFPELPHGQGNEPGKHCSPLVPALPSPAPAPPAPVRIGATRGSRYRTRSGGGTAPAPHTQAAADAAMAEQARAAERAVPTLPTEPADDDEAAWLRYFDLLEAANSVRGDLSGVQERTAWTAPDALPTGVVFTGDWHCGAGGVDYAALRANLETIRDTPGLYAIGMGDYLENVAPQSKAGTALYTGLFNEPGVQGRYALTRAKIAMGRWLAIVNGNHDNWSFKHAGLSRTDEFARALGAAYFTEGGGAVVATVGAQRYVLAVRHNTAGNSRINTENPMRRMFTDFPLWDNCDVICVGHLHYNDLHVVSLKGQRCVYLRSGSFKARDGYAQSHGFTPEIGTPLVVLYPDERRVIAFRGDDFAAGVRFLAAERARYEA